MKTEQTPKRTLNAVVPVLNRPQPPPCSRLRRAGASGESRPRQGDPAVTALGRQDEG